MCEISSSHNDYILSDIILLFILNDHIPGDILNIVDAAQYRQAHHMIPVGRVTYFNLLFTGRILRGFLIVVCGSRLIRGRSCHVRCPVLFGRSLRIRACRPISQHLFTGPLSTPKNQLFFTVF